MEAEASQEQQDHFRRPRWVRTLEAYRGAKKVYGFSTSFPVVRTFARLGERIAEGVVSRVPGTNHIPSPADETDARLRTFHKLDVFIENLLNDVDAKVDERLEAPTTVEGRVVRTATQVGENVAGYVPVLGGILKRAFQSLNPDHARPLALPAPTPPTPTPAAPAPVREPEPTTAAPQEPVKEVPPTPAPSLDVSAEEAEKPVAQTMEKEAEPEGRKEAGQRPIEQQPGAVKLGPKPARAEVPLVVDVKVVGEDVGGAEEKKEVVSPPMPVQVEHALAGPFRAPPVRLNGREGEEEILARASEEDANDTKELAAKDAPREEAADVVPIEDVVGAGGEVVMTPHEDVKTEQTVEAGPAKPATEANKESEVAPDTGASQRAVGRTGSSASKGQFFAQESSGATPITPPKTKGGKKKRSGLFKRLSSFGKGKKTTTNFPRTPTHDASQPAPVTPTSSERLVAGELVEDEEEDEEEVPDGAAGGNKDVGESPVGKSVLNDRSNVPFVRSPTREGSHSASSTPTRRFFKPPFSTLSPRGTPTKTKNLLSTPTRKFGSFFTSSSTASS